MSKTELIEEIIPKITNSYEKVIEIGKVKWLIVSHNIIIPYGVVLNLKTLGATNRIPLERLTNEELENLKKLI